MIIIEKEKLWVYDYIYPCYKATTQRIIHLNVVHSIKIHDSGTVNDNIGVVFGGNELDEDFNRRISPLKDQ